jgi:hypothetical protein
VTVPTSFSGWIESILEAGFKACAFLCERRSTGGNSSHVVDPNTPLSRLDAAFLHAEQRPTSLFSVSPLNFPCFL